ncbi:MAG: AbgT family transporter, partial [Planctomycetota bacterium]|nr:AbgT family transporter [Planctomycetota bacterium]
MTAKTDAAPANGGLLGRIEWLGNKLPDPATLFLLGTLFVMALSAVAVGSGWEVVHELPRVQADGSVRWEVVQEAITGADGAEVLQDKVSRPTSLLTGDGLFWLLSTLVKNFTGFAPLGVVLVGMLGIGLAERVGLIAVLLKYLMQWVSARFLTPAMVFL